MSSWSRVQFDRKQLNRTLTRCKNGQHTAKKHRAKERDNKRLGE